MSFLPWQDIVTCYPTLLVVGHTRFGHILHFCQRVSISSVSISLYIDDDQPRGTMHSSPKYTTTGNRDTGPTALLRPVSQWWVDIDNSGKCFRVTSVTRLQDLVVCRCYLNTSCIKRLLFCTNTLFPINGPLLLENFSVLWPKVDIR
jgi:hypothetical protein